MRSPSFTELQPKKKGVFVNPALTEPFGLTLLEALACGLPVVATSDGGPKDIMSNCAGGLLVDPSNTKAIAAAIKKIIVDNDRWNRYSKNGILNTRKFYTWESHSDLYSIKVKHMYDQWEKSFVDTRAHQYPIGERLTTLSHFLVTDIDNTLLGGGKKGLRTLLELLEKHKDYVGFAVATGRTFESAVDILTANGIDMPDVIISDVGTRISYGDQFIHDNGWETHISKNWRPELIKTRLKEIPFIRMQEDEVQTRYKVSYFMEPEKDRLNKVHHVLTRNRFKYTLIYSQDRHLDVLPYRASKGKAIRYLSLQVGDPPQQYCGVRRLRQ